MLFRRFVIGFCLVAMLGTLSCSDSDDDDVINGDLPLEAQAEAAIEDVLNNVVDPLVALIETLEGLVNAPGPLLNSGVAGVLLECPTTTGVCATGSVSCVAGETSLTFTFSECNVVLQPLIADGELEFQPTGAESFIVTLTSLAINGESPLTGALSTDSSGNCSDDWSVTAADGTTLLASLVGCGDYPESVSSTVITVLAPPDTWTFSFTYDGTQTANVFVQQNAVGVSTCQVDLETFDANCTALSGR
jgi:hypothetical protein